LAPSCRKEGGREGGREGGKERVSGVVRMEKKGEEGEISSTQQARMEGGRE